MAKRKAPPDNLFGLPNRRGRPRKPQNPFELDISSSKYALVKKRGRPSKPKPFFTSQTTSTRKKSPKSLSSKTQSKPLHPATLQSTYIVFLPAMLLCVLIPSLSVVILGLSFILFLFVLNALHQKHRDKTLADVTNPLIDTDIYAPLAPAITGLEFEHEVAWLFNTLTKYQARVVGGSGDGGVDVEIYNSGQLVGIAQCKRYDPTKSLPPAPVRELYAVMHQKGVAVGYLFTTARVSQKTLDEAHRLGIKMVYGARLLDMRHKARQKAGKYPMG